MPKYCSEPFDTININQFGSVNSCLCSNWHNQGTNFGNLNKATLKDIYQAVKFLDMRNSIIDQSFKYCRIDQCSKLHNLNTIDNFDSIELNPELPTTINLMIDNNCNLKCASCRNKNIYSKKINLAAKKILDQLMIDYADFDQTVKIFCDGSGDVFTSAAYQEFFNSQNLPRCFKFCIQTNGNLVTKNISLLTKIKNQIDIMLVSFDAARSSTYKIVRGGDFDLVIEGVRQMVDVGINVTTQFVAQKQNYLEILDYVKLSKDLGVSHIGLQKIDRWPHMTNNMWIQTQIDDNPTVDYKFLINALVELDKDPQVGLCGGLKNLINTKSITISN